MTFGTGLINDPARVGGGEVQGLVHATLTARVFEDGLRVGRFAKFDAGSVDNFDGSAAPVIAGVVKRNPSAATSELITIDGDLHNSANYVRQGFVTVYVKAGDTPALLGRVYVSNAGDASDGMATTLSTSPPANAEFIEEVKTGVWLVYVTPAPGDIAAHIAEPAGAHAAAAISVNSVLTTTTSVAAAVDEILLKFTTEVADPGDAGAILATRNATVALTSLGVETRTLARPTFAGQSIHLSMNVDGGDITTTVAAAINQAGNTIITFNDAGDTVSLVGVTVAGLFTWRVIENNGTTLS